MSSWPAVKSVILSRVDDVAGICQRGELEHVVAGLALQGIAAGATDDEIVAGATIERVVASAAE